MIYTVVWSVPYSNHFFLILSMDVLYSSCSFSKFFSLITIFLKCFWLPILLLFRRNLYFHSSVIWSYQSVNLSVLASNPFGEHWNKTFEWKNKYYMRIFVPYVQISTVFIPCKITTGLGHQFLPAKHLVYSSTDESNRFKKNNYCTKRQKEWKHNCWWMHT